MFFGIFMNICFSLELHHNLLFEGICSSKTNHLRVSFIVLTVVSLVLFGVRFSFYSVHIRLLDTIVFVVLDIFLEWWS